MKLTVLGSGTYQPDLNRHSSSYLLQIENKNLVFDFGRGVLDQLMRVGINYPDIDSIFISHTHADHCSELGSFLHVALAEPYKGQFRTKELTIYGPKGLKYTISHILKAFNLQDKRPKYKIKIKELSNGENIKDKNYSVIVYSTNHSQSVKSLAYRVEAADKIFAYGGDGGDSRGLRLACFDADLAVIEASWPAEMQPKSHLSGVLAGKIATECNIKRLVATHIAPYYLNNFNPQNEISQYFNGKIHLATDLLQIEI